MYCLAGLIIHSAAKGRTLQRFMVEGHAIAVSRTQLADEALRWGADSLLWLDDDHSFPDDALERLIAHDLPVVGCNYLTRRTHRHTASIDSKGKTGVEAADFLGLGLCLISAEAMKAVPFPQFDPGWRGREYESDDVDFFRKLKAAGYQPHVDHALSMEVGHIAETTLYFPR